MNERSDKKGWERTNVTNLLRNGQSGTYYARVKVNGKEKWKSLRTSVAGVRKSKDRADMVRLLAYSGICANIRMWMQTKPRDCYRLTPPKHGDCWMK